MIYDTDEPCQLLHTASVLPNCVPGKQNQSPELYLPSQLPIYPSWVKRWPGFETTPYDSATRTKVRCTLPLGHDKKCHIQNNNSTYEVKINTWYHLLLLGINKVHSDFVIPFGKYLFILHYKGHIVNWIITCPAVSHNS